MDTDGKYRLVRDRLQGKSPFFGGILLKNEPVMDAAWRSALAADLETLFGDLGGPEFDRALEGYVEFSIDAAKSQEYFLKRGHYKARNFSEVRRDLLDNADHMLGNYLPGLFLSHYFWPHHYHMCRRYRSEVIPRVRDRSPRLFVEVGTGSAVYTLLTMGALPDVRGIGYDISPHSVAFGRRVAAAFGFAGRFAFVERDAFADPPRDKADYIVCQEVLEHLEDPSAFCGNLHGILRDDGCAYVTAAVTAAHSDHIHLFKDPAELKSMLEAAGFRSVICLEESSTDTRVPERTPRICGHLVVKA